MKRDLVSGLMMTVVLWSVPLLASPASLAQEVSPAPTAEQASHYFDAEDWSNAATSYQALVNQEPGNGQAWFRLGLVRYKLKQYDLAVAAYEQAERLGFSPIRTMYNLASTYSVMLEKEKAFAWLEKALSANLFWVEMLRMDADLSNLRNDPRFESILDRADRNARPCAYNSEYWQFDFWVGEWEVVTPEGQHAGTNIVQKAENGCLLLENWISALGTSGKSMSFYDPSIKKWRQSWVDSQGGIIMYEGEYKDGAMYFLGQAVSKDGTTQQSRMTFTPLPDGRIRQVIDQSKDGGRTWSPYSDGYYVRK